MYISLCMGRRYPCDHDRTYLSDIFANYEFNYSSCLSEWRSASAVYSGTLRRSPIMPITPPWRKENLLTKFIYPWVPVFNRFQVCQTAVKLWRCRNRWKRRQLQLRRRCRLLAPFKPRNTASWIRKVNCTRFSVHNTIEKFFCVHLASRGSEYTYLYIHFFPFFQCVVTCSFGIDINTMD